MSIICNVDYKVAEVYRGLNLKAKYNGKKHQVFLKLICDDFNLSESIELAKVSKNIAMIEYQGLETSPVYRNVHASGVYVGRVFMLGNNFTEGDISRIVSGMPDGVTPVIKLPEDFKDMHMLWSLNKKYDKVRFCGGKLFSIHGVNVGAVGIDIVGSSSVDDSNYTICGMDDVLEHVDISELDIETSTKSEHKKSGTKKASSGVVKKKPQVSFASMMARGGVVAP